MTGKLRVGGVSSMAGGLLAIVLTPLFASSYLEPGEASPTQLVDGIRSGAGPLLEFASVETVYQTYGRIYVLASLLMFVGLAFFRQRLVGPEANSGRLGSLKRSSRLTRSGLKTATLGWILFPVGLVGDYVIGDALGEILYNVSFIIELLGVLLILIGAVLLGLSLRRTGTFPSSISWLLILSLPIGVIALLLLGHLPSGPMLGISLVAVFVGWHLWSWSEKPTVARADS